MPEVAERTEMQEVDERVVEGLRVPDDVRDLEPEKVTPAPPAKTVRWLPWLLLVAVIAAVATMVVVLNDDGTEAVRDVDGSFQVVETARFTALEPTVDGFQAVETARFMAFDTTVVASPNQDLAPVWVDLTVVASPNQDLAPTWE